MKNNFLKSERTKILSAQKNIYSDVNKFVKNVGTIYITIACIKNNPNPSKNIIFNPNNDSIPSRKTVKGFYKKSS
jgi:hypothetical protein